MRKFKLKKQNKGLTLIETLVAISVLLIGVVFPMSIYSQSITNTRYAGDQITAYYLAQEGVEFIKYKIDTNINGGSGWMSSNLNKCTSGQNCKVDAVYGDVCFQGGPVCDNFLKVNNGLYNYVSGTQTKFKREVDIKQISTNEATITVTVFWENASGTDSVMIKENVYDWR